MNNSNLQDFVDLPSLPNLFLVSKEGEIFSKRTQKIIKPTINRKGYCTLCTRIGGRKGKAVCIRIHREVATAFIENPENKPFINHKDGNKRNNKVENLEWVTASENTVHAYTTGLINIVKGQDKQNSVLKDEDIYYIRENYVPYSPTYGARALGRKYGVAHSIIQRILKRETWKHL